jgi:hypothetical protein
LWFSSFSLLKLDFGIAGLEETNNLGGRVLRLDSDPLNGPEFRKNYACIIGPDHDNSCHARKAGRQSPPVNSMGKQLSVICGALKSEFLSG